VIDTYSKKQVKFHEYAIIYCSENVNVENAVTSDDDNGYQVMTIAHMVFGQVSCKWKNSETYK
jgi:hypothetical protein